MIGAKAFQDFHSIEQSDKRKKSDLKLDVIHQAVELYRVEIVLDKYIMCTDEFKKAVGDFILTFSNFFAHSVGRLGRIKYLIISMEFSNFINPF